MFSLRLARGAGVPLGELRLVDLPGYGYAQVSRAERNSWQALIEGYTRRRRALALFVILVDARRGIEDEERQLYEWLGTENVPAQIVFTKIDKLSATERGLLKERNRKLFGRRAPILVSSESGEGLAALWSAVFEAAAARDPVQPGTVQVSEGD
jgi:GTP-binding protein